MDRRRLGSQVKLKNRASKRWVPIHSQLIALGLLDYIEQLRKRGHDRLFPTFNRDVKNGYGRTLGRWFNDRFLPKLGLKTTKLSFHSLRHTAVTTMMHADIEEPIVQSVVGHTKSGVTQQYYFKAGYTLAQLSEAVETIRFE
ncbi:tyrosine-type recombinase/integrase [Starkeya nomas]|uniref:tyrosine-type recombinase/integrase n=1 Tax=Starkeya nomas TaxID=2666134 RepID=UPI0013573CD9